ncbi:hypothetical protein PF005_g22843 [Phytophthora fragariae]|uniref:HMA domain-containing protein n=1 Tax=Phytophthora fragariae TaxID=53985 RepID=A0A6A3XV26_9STRA|nr:hypothetical protein PF010_g26285 [Phytophthora fragariae]KAE9070969.1 hypothetical protein PF007_g26732 [Phytophthora fragariae]KAE9181548.1 hypothetical protein PF005_g22843 [Phytophthora fragariae]KAE9207782.1 hypothetical protein PF002_g19610 [Phytophthora fragariae]
MGFGAAVKPPTRTQTRELELELELLVEGMMCQKNCGATVENALRGVEGVSSAVVSFEQRQAAMTLRRPGSATLQELVDEVGCVGFEAGAYDAVKAAAVKLQAQRQQNIQQQEKSLDVRDAASRRKADVAFGRDLVPSARQTQLIQDAGDDDSLELKVTVAGMSGAACVGKIEAAVGALPGVSKVLVDLPPHKAYVHLVQFCVDGGVGAARELQSSPLLPVLGTALDVRYAEQLHGVDGGREDG